MLPSFPGVADRFSWQVHADVGGLYVYERVESTRSLQPPPGADTRHLRYEASWDVLRNIFQFSLSNQPVRYPFIAHVRKTAGQEGGFRE